MIHFYKILKLVATSSFICASIVNAASAATYTVSKTTDTNDGVCGVDCSLREAVIAANNLPGQDTIIIPDGVYTLSIAGAGEENAATGDLDIYDDLVITGNGPSNTIIEAGSTPGALGDRIFHVSPLGTGLSSVVISGVTLRHGSVTGSGSPGSGGAIYALGSLDISDCRVEDNSAMRNGGGIYFDFNQTYAISDCVFSGNSGYDGGAVSRFSSGQLSIDNSAFINNTAIGKGGAVHTTSNSTITNSSFSGNQSFKGGALALSGGIFSLSGLTVSNNIASAWAGGIYGETSFRLKITDSVISHNQAQFGGGIRSEFATIFIANSTISNNQATTSGGGIYNYKGAISLNNTTIAENSSPAGANGGNLYNFQFSPGTIQYRNTIIADPVAGDNCTAFGGNLISEGYNIDSSNTCNLTNTGDLINTDPMINALAANGGPTQTHALSSFSPAVDAGNPSGCTWDDDYNASTSEVALTVDQRGLLRPVDGDNNAGPVCDIGAFELQENEVSKKATKDHNGDGKSDVMLRHSDGRWYYYPMNGKNILVAEQGGAALTSNTSWQYQGSGDYNGDGKADVLVRHTDGRWFYFPMNGKNVLIAQQGGANLTTNTSWQYQGSGDMNGDGKDDVLVRHSDGRWFYFPMNGKAVLTAQQGVAKLTTNLSWQFAGMGDLNGDGKDDVLVRHTDGRWFYFPMNGRNVLVAQQGGAALTTNLSWQFAGIGDMNSDGKDDVLVRHADGRWFYFPMNGKSVLIAQQGVANITNNTSWQFAGMRDMNGDGKDDVLVRHTDGRWYYFPMNGKNVLIAQQGRAFLTGNTAWELP